MPVPLRIIEHPAQIGANKKNRYRILQKSTLSGPHFSTFLGMQCLCYLMFDPLCKNIVLINIMEGLTCRTSVLLSSFPFSFLFFRCFSEICRDPQGSPEISFWNPRDGQRSPNLVRDSQGWREIPRDPQGSLRKGKEEAKNNETKCNI